MCLLCGEAPDQIPLRSLRGKVRHLCREGHRLGKREVIPIDTPQVCAIEEEFLEELTRLQMGVDGKFRTNREGAPTGDILRSILYDDGTPSHLIDRNGCLRSTTLNGVIGIVIMKVVVIISIGVVFFVLVLL